jgi:hypothetical protein
MGPLTALALATPIFGFALAPPSQLTPLPQSALPIAAQLESSGDEEGSVDLSASAAVGSAGDEESGSAKGPTVSEKPADQGDYVKQLRKRAKIAKVHRTLGIATWAATAIAVAAGTVQFRNLYGGGNRDKTPCATGDAWPNQKQCYGAPLLHAIPGFVAGGLYFTTMGLAWAMPDPDKADQGDSKFAKTVRTHKILRWIHLAGMLAQIGIGVVIANPKLALNRYDDYGTLQTLARAHLGIGYVTFAALTWAGTIMLL